MHANAMQVGESPALRRDLRTFITEQLGTVLEQRALRIGVVGTMLVLACVMELVPARAGVDAGWLFIMPVVVSAIAGGLAEGLVVAFCTALLASLFSFAQAPAPALPVLVGMVAGRCALFGIAATFLGVFAEAHHSVQMRFRQLASMDPLTKVANVARFYEEIGILEAAATRFAVLVVDLDDLKVVNDRWGHQVGSAAIRTVANVLKRVVRSTDCVARYGGDEFVVILEQADAPGARIVANRIREELAAEVLPGAEDQRVSVSIGIALYGRDGTTSEELLDAADRAMYVDKRFRKDRLPVL